MGFQPVTFDVQTTSMSTELRNSLWNVVHVHHLHNRDRPGGELYPVRLRRIAFSAQLEFFKLPIDELEVHSDDYVERIKNWFFKSEFYQVYDLIEWLAQFGAQHLDAPSARAGKMDFSKAVNSTMQDERAGYRLVQFNFVPITNEVEIEAVNAAATQKAGFEAVAAHIQAAISLLSDRKNPDFRNSIKESISAVEAAARAVTGNEKATLGDALKELEKTKKIHPALRDGFLKIYGYSSDADGIRHAMSELPNINESDARFMLVSCSAFSAFLVEQAEVRT